MILESRMRKAESGTSAGIRPCSAAQANAHCAALRRGYLRSSILDPNSSILTPRSAFTLVELLVTMAIMAIMATVILGASRSAIEAARRARTKTMITKLHTLLMQRYESYQTRRVEVITSGLTPAQLANGRFMADVRLLGKRELMKLEMPDRWSDIVINDIPDSNPLSVPNNVLPDTLRSLPSLTSTYRRRYFALRTEDGSQLDGNRIRRNQGAECLYMIVMLATGDGEARTLFGQQDIADTDGDGAPEFIDGWGNPIQFVRWPAGFWERSELISGDADTDHDPIDLFRRDMAGVVTPPISAYPSPYNIHMGVLRARINNDGISAYRLIPLIYSAGPDGITDINIVPGGSAGLDPYGLDQRIGAPFDDDNDGEDNSIDNIHNQLLD